MDSALPEIETAEARQILSSIRIREELMDEKVRGMMEDLDARDAPR